MLNLKNLGFTLAEVLTTLLIIGVIAVIILPILHGGTNEKLLDSQKKTFSGKLNEGLHRMQIKGALSKEYESTEDFVNTMKNYFNFSKTCKNDNLAGCFGDKIKTSQTTTLYQLKNVATSEDIGINFQTPSNLMGIVFNDGSRAIMAYNTDCVITNMYDSDTDVTACIAMYYDVNGSGGNSIIGEDIEQLNITQSAEDIEIGEIFTPSNFSLDQCEDAKKEGAPINECRAAGEDKWANAVYKCFKQGKRLPNKNELKAIAYALYGEPIALNNSTTGLSIKDASLKSKLQIPDGGALIYFWACEEHDSNSANHRYFSESGTYYGTYQGGRHTSKKAFCVNK